MSQPPHNLSSPFTSRWEQLKPIIEQLYLKEKKKLNDVIQTMKTDYGFDAVEHQYKHHFKKWKWKKNIPKAKKENIAEQLESRARAGKLGASINFQGRKVEPHKIRRHMKTKARADSQAMVLKNPAGIENVVAEPVLPFANSIFLKWNVPYAAMRRSYVRAFDHSSPLGFPIPTPGSDISVATPSADSPQNAPSPTALLKEKATIDRAHLVMSEWLYQYWFFCFKTAKSWGRGPRAWTAELLDFDRYHHHSRRSLPGTPQDPMAQSEEQSGLAPVPTNNCRWFIHVQRVDYEEIPEEISRDTVDQDPNDESTWSPWPEDWQEPPLPTRLRDALEHNDFSSITAATLPVAIPQVAKAAQRSPDELLLESLGFSIMARNLTQVESIMRQLRGDIDYTSLYPFHMATSYLDGYKACCNIFTTLLMNITGPKISKVFVNELGHTILDNLMISILKSHSSAIPAVVDDTLKDTARFVGEEIDICGRWDADSPCVRHLLATGNPSTPFAWKHKFCHTSIQTVCHCIIQMYELAPTRLMTETASGLYVRRCFHCGTKLELQPLHSLVMTAYYLANSGCQDEDLFGMLACLLCLISCGLDLRKTASVSVTAFMQTDNPEGMCDHEELTPAALADKISTYPIISSWSTKVRSGWAVFCGVLRLREDALMEEYDDLDDDPYFIDTTDLSVNRQDICRHPYDSWGHFGTRGDLTTLWASVQAELLTYRRLDDGMDWISQHFSMEELRDQLERGEPLSVKFAEQGLLQPHCICGRFNCYPFAILSSATTPDIANLDIWERANYGLLLDD